MHRGGRGRGRGGGWGPPRATRHVDCGPPSIPGTAASGSHLRTALFQLDGAPYPALRDLEGQSLVVPTEKGSVTVSVVRAQPDPFAPGSQVRICVPLPWMPGNSTAFTDTHIRRVAAEDFLLRRVHEQLATARYANEAITVLPVSQHVLQRSALTLENTDECEGLATLFCRVQVPGPRRVLAFPMLEGVFLRSLVPAVAEALQCANVAMLTAHVNCVEDQDWLRQQLPSRNLVAFVANGSVLPRASGEADGPLVGPHVLPFRSPPDLEVTFALPRQQVTITGMGIASGLTLLVGGGFQGKSTLLRALEVGVYNHTLGDGREYVVTDPSAVKIRAEDRRSVQGVDISPFVSRLQCPTTHFCTGDASGSTSQAANMVEALELGSRVLLLDEDTCATNLMYRDTAMCELIDAESEPITTLLQRLPEVLASGVSLVVVAGGSGQYFAHASVVVMMDKYAPKNVTQRAKDIAEQFCRQPVVASPLLPRTSFAAGGGKRMIDVAGSFMALRNDCRVKAHGTRAVSIGACEIDLSLVEQMVEIGQTNAIAAALAWLVDHVPQVPPLLAPAALVAQLAEILMHNRLRVASQSFHGPIGFLAMPRPMEVGAALNRLRTLCAPRAITPAPGSGCKK